MTGESAAWRARVREAPDSPGVYLLRDADGEVLYVGKAGDLRARLRSYLDPARQGPKTEHLVRRAAQLEWFLTDNEIEALILENSLIKRWRPRYNIRLRDDKTYPFLRLSVQEEYPALTVVRRPQPDGARYFGPYIPAAAMRETLRVLRRLFPLRLCRRIRPGRPCLNFQMGRCPAPCGGRVAPEDYRERVRGVTLFLQGKGALFAAELRARMEAAAADLRYEEAASLRDRIAAIEAVMERQKVHLPAQGDMDVMGLVRLGARVGLSVLHVREGRLVGTEQHALQDPLEGEGEAFDGILRAYYAADREVPPEILVPAEGPGQAALEGWLERLRGGKVRLRAPRAGEKKSLLLLAVRNAMRLLQEERHAAPEGDALLEELARLAGVAGPLRSLAAMDVSNLSGTDAVASLVWWEGGAPRRARYRRFRVRRGGGPDDFAMLGEVVGRLAGRVAGGSWAGPDALLLDGGRGQLAAGAAALAGAAWRPRLLLAIAKPSERRGTDAVFREGGAAALELAPDSPVLRLLQRVRDEAHRFAVSYHRLLRERRLRGGVLEGVTGIGPARRARLLRHFGSLAALRRAGPAELAAVLPAALAARLHAALHPEERDAGASPPQGGEGG